MSAHSEIGKMIDHMLERPDMYAATPQELEMSVLTALSCWEIARARSCGRAVVDTTLVWRNVVAERIPGPQDVARLAMEGTRMREVVDGLKVVRDRLAEQEA